LEQLLEKDYAVVTTVRSEDKAQKIRNAFPDKAKAGKLEIVLVPDIAKPDAFDEVAKTPGLDAVIHVASPFHYNISESQCILGHAWITD
jgi:saccharopine dehydrogenase-like NADP-dependent oxidoreductase